MPHLTRQHSEALRRIEDAFRHDAREVEVGVPDGFGRRQVVDHLAAHSFAGLRVLVVVSHPARVAHAFETGLAGGSGRRVGLILSDSEVEVVSLSAARGLAAGGRLGHGAIVLDGLRPDQEPEADEVVRACSGAQVVRLRDASEPDPDHAFVVRVVSSRDAAPAGHSPT